MKDEVVYIEDPLGHMVSFQKEMLFLDAQDTNTHDLYDDLYSVIKKPALLIQTDPPKELNYFRSLGWQFSVLIKAKPGNSHWEAYKCIINPSDKDIVALMKAGTQII